MAIFKNKDGESTPPKKNLLSRITGREKFKTSGTVDSGRTYKMKEVTKSNGATKTVGIKKEKGLFGAKEKNIYKTTPISQGGVDRIKVKSKSITKAPGLLGKRTVKKSSYVRDVPAPSNVSGKGIPGPSMKTAPMLNNRLEKRSSSVPALKSPSMNMAPKPTMNPTPPMKKSPALNTRMDIRGTDSMRDSQRQDLTNKNQAEREKMSRALSAGLGVGVGILKKKP
jgi:hypothetical protein